MEEQPLVKTVIDGKNSKETLEEAKRHNKAMEGVTIGKRRVLEYGLYLKKQPKKDPTEHYPTWM